MVIQKLLFLMFLMLITNASALFYFFKDHKHHGHDEVDHHKHHHHDDHKHHEHHHEHYHHDHKHHDHHHDHKHHEHEHHNHKYQGHHHEEHKHHEQKQEHKHEHKMQQMQKHHEHEQHHHHHHHHHQHGHEQHKQDHKHQEKHKHKEEHKHHEHKHHDHHHHEHHHDHKHHEHHHEHKHHEHHHDHKHHEHYQEHKHQGQLHYEFKYGVRDPSTGDIKNQWEIRKGDDVLGEYSLVEADGTIRTVQYTAGKHTGFNAIVKKEGKAKHPIAIESSGQKTFPPVKTTYHIVKPVTPEPIVDLYEPKVEGIFPDSDTSHLPYYVPAEYPMNHKPVYAGIDEETNLLALYKHYPTHSIHQQEEKGFDYGINEYLSKRSYDLSKITKELNEHIHTTRSVDPLKAARGRFAMGR